MKGYKLGPMSEEHKRKISEANKGKPKPKLIGNQNSKGMPPNKTSFKKGQLLGKNNVNWKGNKAGYGALHSWIYRHFGKPVKCEKCGITNIKSYFGHWHNISGQYKRERSDWKRLCAKCHRATF